MNEIKILIKLTNGDLKSYSESSEDKFRNWLSSFSTTCKEVIEFEGNLSNGASLFKGFTALEKCLALPSALKNAEEMFMDCTALTAVCELPKNLVVCTGMFRNCISYNQLTIVPSSVQDVRWMFAGCEALSREVVFETHSFNVFRIVGVFNDCKNLNVAVTIPIAGDVRYPIQVCKGAPGVYDMHHSMYMPDKFWEE